MSITVYVIMNREENPSGKLAAALDRSSVSIVCDELRKLTSMVEELSWHLDQFS